MMKKVTPTPSAKRNISASTSSEEEEVTELRQRIRIRKREKLLEVSREWKRACVYNVAKLESEESVGVQCS